jgi:hypothetical protein
MAGHCVSHLVPSPGVSGSNAGAAADESGETIVDNDRGLSWPIAARAGRSAGTGAKVGLDFHDVYLSLFVLSEDENPPIKRRRSAYLGKTTKLESWRNMFR